MEVLSFAGENRTELETILRYLEKISYFKEVKESSPYTVAEHSLFLYDHQTYINILFSPIIYKVSSDKIESVFKVSFGRQTFPPDDYISEMIADGASGIERLIKLDCVNSCKIMRLRTI